MGGGRLSSGLRLQNDRISGGYPRHDVERESRKNNQIYFYLIHFNAIIILKLKWLPY